MHRRCRAQLRQILAAVLAAAIAASAAAFASSDYAAAQKAPPGAEGTASGAEEWDPSYKLDPGFRDEIIGASRDPEAGERLRGVIVVVGRCPDGRDGGDAREAVAARLEEIGARDVAVAESLSFVTARVPVGEVLGLAAHECVFAIGDGETEVRPAVTPEPAPREGPDAEAPAQPPGGGCLIATAAYGTELAPQVQRLREARDGVIAYDPASAAIMGALHAAYYSFSPAAADLQRQSPEVAGATRLLVAPALYPLFVALSDITGPGSCTACDA